MTSVAGASHSMSRGSLSLADLDTTFNDEPRILDLLLAERLRLTQPLNVRRVIENNRSELEMHGEVFTRDVKTAGIRGGRPSKEFWLNEGQALVICSLSRTPAAAAIRHAVITVYMEYRRREVAGQTIPVSAHRRRPALARTGDVTRLGLLVDRLESMAIMPGCHSSPVNRDGLAAFMMGRQLVIVDTRISPGFMGEALIADRFTGALRLAIVTELDTPTAQIVGGGKRVGFTTTPNRPGRWPCSVIGALVQRVDMRIGG